MHENLYITFTGIRWKQYKNKHSPWRRPNDNHCGAIWYRVCGPTRWQKNVMPPDFYMLSSAVLCSRVSEGPDSLCLDCQQICRLCRKVTHLHEIRVTIVCIFVSKLVLNPHNTDCTMSSIDVFSVFTSYLLIPVWDIYNVILTSHNSSYRYLRRHFA